MVMTIVNILPRSIYVYGDRCICIHTLSELSLSIVTEDCHLEDNMYLNIYPILYAHS